VAFEVGVKALTSSHRKAAAAIMFMEKPCGTYAARLSRLGAGLIAGSPRRDDIS